MFGLTILRTAFPSLRAGPNAGPRGVNDGLELWPENVAHAQVGLDEQNIDSLASWFDCNYPIVGLSFKRLVIIFPKNLGTE